MIFVHGSGSSRHSPRNKQVAEYLADHRCATFLFDLLTNAEAADRTNVFNIPLLAARVTEASNWLVANSSSFITHHSSLPISFFGASTGAAAALVASTKIEHKISAIVSRGGRPDLAGNALPDVTAATLLIVGSRDEQVLDLNQQARSRMTCESRLTVIDGATHLFEEPGTLDQVSHHAAKWFTTHFST